jgi:TetR/AcrR family transcriptional regulator, transcriptional repressor for nem operon
MIKSANRLREPAKAQPRTAAATAILDVAEQLAQVRGYNGFSYADVAAQLGVTKASLHYHFPSKAQLGAALIDRYQTNFDGALRAIDGKTKNPSEKLNRYVDLYDSVLRNDRMCLCGMLAAEYATLPSSMQAALTSFFDANERWLTAVIQSGLNCGAFFLTEAANVRAGMLLGALEGAMLIARSYGDPSRFRTAAGLLLADMGRGKRRSRPASSISAARQRFARR